MAKILFRLFVDVLMIYSASNASKQHSAWLVNVTHIVFNGFDCQ